MTGVDKTDKRLADEAAGFVGSVKRPVGYTWHHNQDCRTMELIPTELNKAVDHTGGAAIARAKPSEGE